MLISELRSFIRIGQDGKSCDVREQDFDAKKK